MTISKISDRATTGHERPTDSARTIAGGVLVGYEGTWRSTPALQRAATEAAERGMPLTLLTVVSTGDDPGLSSQAQQREAVARWERASGDGAHALDAVRSRHPGLPASLRVVLDSDLTQVRHELQQTRLLVLGTTGHDGPRAFLLGSTSHQLVKAVACPVLVVPDTPPASAARQVAMKAPGALDTTLLTGAVVVGVRHGPESAGLLRVAAAEASRRGARLCVAHAYLASGDAGTPAQVHAQISRLIAQAGLDAGLHVTTIITPDAVAGALLGLGARADLLVVGSRGTVAMARLVLGSVSRAVLDGAGSPVLVVPHAVAEAAAPAGRA